MPRSHQAVAGGSGVHRRSCCTRALARTTSFLITAVMATLGGFPASTSAAYFRSEGEIGADGGQCRHVEHPASLVPSALDEAAPPPGTGLPGHRSQPRRDWRPGGRFMVPSSGMWTMSPAAVTPEMPGIEVRISHRRLSVSSLWRSFTITASMRFRLALDLRQTLLVDPLGQGVAQVLAAIEDAGTVLDQRVADQLQFGEVALAFGFGQGRSQVVNRLRHRRQRACVDRVGLGAAPLRARKAPNLVRIDRVQRKSSLQQGILQVAVEGAGGLVGDTQGPWTDPGSCSSQIPGGIQLTVPEVDCAAPWNPAARLPRPGRDRRPHPAGQEGPAPTRLPRTYPSKCRASPFPNAQSSGVPHPSGPPDPVERGHSGSVRPGCACPTAPRHRLLALSGGAWVTLLFTQSTRP